MLIIFSAFILTLLPYFIDGQMGCVGKNCGFIFGTNYRDGLWFFAIANNAFHKIPFIHPTFAGETLTGYHFLPNFLVFLLSKIGISPFFSYFKLIPLFYFLIITFLLFKILITIKNDLIFLNLGSFFFYFGIPFTLLVSLINHQPLSNGLLINTFQATRVLESPHTAIGLIIIFLVYYWLLKNKLDENDTAYVAAFSHKSTYLNFLTINQTLGVNYQERLKKIEDPQNFNPEKIKVKYFYLPKQNPYSQKIIDKFNPKKYQKTFENKKVVIFLKK